MITGLKSHLDATADALTLNPAAAQMQVTVAGDLVGAFGVSAHVGEHTVDLDMPEALGGGGTAPTPGAYVLVALGACQAITYRLWSERLGVEVDDVHFEVSGNVDVRNLIGAGDEARPGFSAAEIHLAVRGPETDERYEEVLRAVQSHSPIFDVFAHPVPTRMDMASRRPE